jgi:hypothetical protein
MRPKLVIRYVKDENKCCVSDGGYTCVQKATMLYRPAKEILFILLINKCVKLLASQPKITAVFDLK